MSKVIQFSQTRVGDNVNSEEILITTVLYDDGSMYEGSMQTVGGDYHSGFQREMVWTMIQLPAMESAIKEDDEPVFKMKEHKLGDCCTDCGKQIWFTDLRDKAPTIEVCECIPF